MAFTLHSFKSPSSVHFSLFESENERGKYNNNNIDNSEEKWQRSAEKQVKTEGSKSLVCVWLFLHQNSLEACLPSFKGVYLVTCLREVSPARKAGWVRGRGASTGGPWRADRGGSLVCKVSLLTAGRNSSVGKAREFMDLGPRVRSPMCTADNTFSVRSRRRCRFLGGSFFLVSLLLGPAKVAFHLHKLWGVLLFLLNLLLLQLQLEQSRYSQI